MPKTLDIILPCYNPIESWEKDVYECYIRICNLIPDVLITLIIVNDGSVKNIDKSIEFLKDKIDRFRYLDNKVNNGKGFALRSGLSISESEIIIFTDIDFPYEDQSLVDLYKELETQKDLDIAVGVRDNNYYKNVPTRRTYISKIFKFFAIKLLSLPVTDTQCGLKGFNRKGKDLFLKTSINRYLFDLEFIYLAVHTKKINLKPVLVKLKPNIKFSKMNFKILSIELMSFFKILSKHYFKF